MFQSKIPNLYGVMIRRFKEILKKVFFLCEIRQKTMRKYFSSLGSLYDSSCNSVMRFTAALEADSKWSKDNRCVFEQLTVTQLSIEATLCSNSSLNPTA